MQCPHCKRRLLQKQGEQTRVRSDGPMLIKSDGCHTQCFWCKSEVVLPLVLAPDADVLEEPRFFLGTPSKKDLTDSRKSGTFQK